MPTQILNKLPKKAKELYDATLKAALQTHDKVRAGKIALSHVLNQFNPVGESWVAKFKENPKYHTIKYVFEAEAGSVSKSIDGLIYRDYVLSTVNKDLTGEAFSDFALKRMTEQINEEGVVGRVDSSHYTWKQLSKEGKDEGQIEDILQSLDTGIKAISANYNNGKLVARVSFTEEAFKSAKDLKGASIEARYPESSFVNGVYHQARLQGFVLTNNPANLEAMAI